ncbi:hypothetical protein [Agromyces salentinus]|uniref:Uncharacterized protein n=1 Tax=Agromyces salentinus TaxID=269421 RepID=A0ABP4Z0K6_9MICO|nr:hypothetical protein [Agromyces salentinus]
MDDLSGAGSTPTIGVEPAPFDVRDFARTAHGSHREGLDLEAIPDAALTREAVRTILTLAELEGATMAHLRNVLVTATHKDARVTAFLVSWAYEKYWVADALRAVAGAAAPVGATRANDASRPAVAAAPVRARGRGPIRRALAGFAQGSDVIGAHLALGCVDDLVLDLAYARLAGDVPTADGTPDPALGDAIRRIRAIKARHSAFFHEEATRRLETSPRAARLARRELSRAAWPLGAASVSDEDRRSFARFALGGDPGSASALERGIRSLAGIDERTAARVTGRLAG